MGAPMIADGSPSRRSDRCLTWTGVTRISASSISEGTVTPTFSLQRTMHSIGFPLWLKEGFGSFELVRRALDEGEARARVCRRHTVNLRSRHVWRWG